MNSTLIYVHDPMCSWCWGFEKVRQQLFANLAGQMNIRRLVGGLAIDSNETMPKDMQIFLQETWRNIESSIPGTEFNFAFWTDCKPRRSTYPSNRAVIAARLQGENLDELMTTRIQQAYYEEARNPSDNSVLIELADDIGLNINTFAADLSSDKIQQLLLEEIRLTRSLGMSSFPSLVVDNDGNLTHIKLNYNRVDDLLEQIHRSQTGERL
ncbi:MAG: putative protein-disulfide isomerase [Enterobacterales bacterium]|jgi:putative protein-disulfide isomerase